MSRSSDEITAMSVAPRGDGDALLRVSSSKSSTKKHITPLELGANQVPCLDAFQILRSVFRFVSVKDLKNCRIVNKVWNVEACGALRRDSYVRIFEAYNEEITAFQKILRVIRNLGTPSPFDRVHFSSSQLKYENVHMLLKDKIISLEHLYVHEPPVSSKVDFQKHLYQILQTNSDSLKSFHCALNDSISLGLLTNLTRSQLYLPMLTEFGYWEGDVGPKPFGLRFVLEIMNGSPNLERFHPKICNEKTLHKVFKNTSSVRNLKELRIQSVNVAFYPHLLKLKLPNVKVLCLDVIQPVESTQKLTSETLQYLVSKFCENLEELSICWPSNTPDISFPACPKLRCLRIDDWTGSLGLLNSNILPSLKSVYKVYNQPFGFKAFLSPHQGVESLTLEDHIDRRQHPFVDFLQSVEEEYTYFLEYASCQYPNLTKLDVTLPLSNALVISIIRIFPQLESLTLQNGHSCLSLGEQVFTGVNPHTLNQYVVEGGQSIQAVPVPRMPCLLDMKKLKHLVLSRYSREGYPSHMIISNNAIQYGIGRMRSLKSLQLNWNYSLDPSVASKSLNHLETIIISDAYRFQPFTILETLKSLLPQLEFE